MKTKLFDKTDYIVLSIIVGVLLIFSVGAFIQNRYIDPIIEFIVGIV